ncbi:MAG: LLM class flavin-dependent oxidoreductase [Chloroflexi bacterium]|nr:LLM class flavin-dependent oxidoreductase [Chloroflexota bacterium]
MRSRVGIQILETVPRRALAAIVEADRQGDFAVWVPTSPSSVDALTLLSAAAVRTKQVRLGTAVIPTFPRHPLVAAQQAVVVSELSGGRFVLGVGPSHEPIISGTFGIPFERPLEHLREYVTLVKLALSGRPVEFEGRRLSMRGQLAVAAGLPVMVSALRPPAFRLAGELADGVLATKVPARYIKEVARPALEDGAHTAGRKTPPLITQVMVALSSDFGEVVRVAREGTVPHNSLPYYTNLLRSVGFDQAGQGPWTEEMIDTLVLHGDEAAVAEKLRRFFADSTVDEVYISFSEVSPRETALERGIRFVAAL